LWSCIELSCIYEKLSKIEIWIKDLIPSHKKLGYVDSVHSMDKIENEKWLGKKLRTELIDIILNSPNEIVQHRKFEEKIKKDDKKLECAESQMEMLNHQINEEENKFRKLRYYIEPINVDRRRHQYNCLVALLKLNLCNPKYLERYYKFKHYKKYFSRYELNSKTCIYLFNLKARLDSILSLKN
jgi:hypothetical protein